MKAAGFISQKEYDTILSADITFTDKPFNPSLPSMSHAALFIRDRLIEMYGEAKLQESFYVVHTTLIFHGKSTLKKLYMLKSNSYEEAVLQMLLLLSLIPQVGTYE